MSHFSLPGSQGAIPGLDVPPEATAAWYREMSRGALLGIGVFFAGTCVYVLTLLPEPPAKVAELVGRPLVTVLGLVSCWMLTAPQPGNPSWQLWSRWMARLGSIAAVVRVLIRSATVYLGQAHLDLIGPPYAQAELVSTVGTAALVWYVFRLAGKIGDRVLAVINGVFAYGLGLLCILTALVSFLDPAETVRKATAKLSADQNWGGGYRSWGSHPAWIAVSVGLASLALFVDVRLWRRLRAAERSTKAA